MSEQKTSAVVVASEERGLFKRLPPKTVLAVKIAIPIIILLIGGVGSWAILQHGAKAPEKGLSNALNPDPVKPDPIIDAYARADELAFAGKYDEAQALLAQAVNAAVNPTDKARYILNRATLAYNQQKYQEALDFAKEAEKVSASSLTAQQIAENAEALGDKATARDYYQKAIDRYDPALKAQDAVILQEYADKIKRLQ